MSFTISPDQTESVTPVPSFCSTANREQLQALQNLSHLMQ